MSSDLLATQQNIKFIENAKSHSDQVINQLSVVYCVFLPDGRILKGNLAFAALLNEDPEGVLNKNIKEIFSAKALSKFEKMGCEILSGNKHEAQFELPVELKGGLTRDYWWHVQALQYSRSDTHPLLVALGQDISDFKKATLENGRMESELLLAQTIQKTLFPSKEGKILETEIYGYYNPASECSGDWWYYNEIGGRIFLWFGDVTGHGAPSALITSAIRAAVSVMELNPNLTPKLAMEILNKVVCESSGGERMASFFVSALDPKSGELTYSSAAHGYILRLPMDLPDRARDIACLETSISPLLGISTASKFTEFKTQLHPSESIVLFTDGLYELRNASGNELSTRKFFTAILDSAKQHAKLDQRVKQVIKACLQHAGEVVPNDDMSLVMVRWNPPRS